MLDSLQGQSQSTLPNDDDILKRLGGGQSAPSPAPKPQTSTLPSDDDILKSLTDDEVLKRLSPATPAPVVNVGAPDRPIVNAQSSSFDDVRKYLPRSKQTLTSSQPPVTSPNSNQSLIDALNNPSQGQEISSITNKPTQSLVERAGGQVKFDAAKAHFKQQQQIRENAFQLALKATPENRDNALRELAKLGPISTNEQQQLGVDSHYPQSFLRPLWAQGEEMLGGVARLAAAGGNPVAKSIYQHLSDAAVEDRLQANIHGERGYTGDILQTAGEIIPQAAAAGLAPEGLAADLAFPATGMLSSAGRGEDAEHIIKAGLANAIPIAGAKVFAGVGKGLGALAPNSLAKGALEFGSRAAPNIVLNEVVGGMAGINDEHGIFTNALMAAIMAKHSNGDFSQGGENAPESKPSLNSKGQVPESSARSSEATQAINNDDLQSAIAQHFANPSTESVENIKAVGERIGLPPRDIWNIIDAANKFKDSLSQKGSAGSDENQAPAQTRDSTTGQQTSPPAGTHGSVAGNGLSSDNKPSTSLTTIPTGETRTASNYPDPNPNPNSETQDSIANRLPILKGAIQNTPTSIKLTFGEGRPPTDAEIQSLFPEHNISIVRNAPSVFHQGEQPIEITFHKPDSTIQIKPPADWAERLGVDKPFAIGEEPTLKGEDQALVSSPVRTPQVGEPLTHSDPELHGKPIVATTAEGKAVVQNDNNKGGVSVVKDQSGQAPSSKQPWELTKSEFDNPPQRQSSKDPIPPVSQTYYHGSNAEGLTPESLRNVSESTNTTTLGDVSTTRHGIFLSNSPEFAAEYGKNVTPFKVDAQNTADVNDLKQEFIDSLDPHGKDRQLWMNARNSQHAWGMFEGELGKRFVKFLKDKGYDSAAFDETLTTGQFSDEPVRDINGETLVVFDKNQVSSGDHRAVVEKALKEGKPVPPEVLKDYPDLQKGATPPPTEPPSTAQSTTPNPEEFITGIKNAQVAQERAARGLPEIETTGRMSDPEAWDAAQQQQSTPQGRIDIRNQTQQWAEKPKPLSKTENAALLHDRVTLHNEHADAMNNMETALKSGDPIAIADAKAKLLKVESDIAINELASKRSGTENALGLQSRQMMARQDYTLDRMVQRYNIANNGEGVPDDIRQKMNDLVKERDAAVKALDDHLAKSKTDALDKTIEAIKRKEQFAVRKGERAQRKQALDVEFQQITKEFNSSISGLHAGIPVDALPALAKMVRNRVQAGVVTVEGLVDTLHETIKDQIDGLTKDDVRSALGQIDLNSIMDEKRQAQGLKATKTRLTNRQAELDKMAASGEFYTNPKTGKETLSKPRTPITLDKDALALREKVARTTDELNKVIRDREYSNRGMGEKVMDKAARWSRMIRLSSTATLGKLASYGAEETLAGQPLKDLAGVILDHAPIVGRISKIAPVEGGGFHAQAQARATVEFFKQMGDLVTKGKETSNIMKTGKSSLDAVFGPEQLSPEINDYFSRIHGALKNPTKAAAFERAVAKQQDFYRAKGIDPTTPEMEMAIGAKAYAKANQSILLGDNALTKFYQSNIISPLQHRAGGGGKLLALALKLELPIVKVPTNFVKETLRANPLGAATAVAWEGRNGIKTAILKRSLTEGLKDISPEQADSIMHSLKSGMIGTGLLALGWMNPDKVGGYYIPNDKRKSTDPQVGGAKIFGVNVPRVFLHNPLLESLQMGATARRVYDQQMKGGPAKKAMASGEALHAVGMGLAEHVPFLEMPIQATKGTETGGSTANFIGGQMRGMVLPPDLQRLASIYDQTHDTSVLDKIQQMLAVKPILAKKRVPQGGVTSRIGQSLELGIPGLRKRVPLKKK